MLDITPVMVRKDEGENLINTPTTSQAITNSTTPSTRKPASTSVDVMRPERIQAASSTPSSLFRKFLRIYKRSSIVV